GRDAGVRHVHGVCRRVGAGERVRHPARATRNVHALAGLTPAAGGRSRRAATHWYARRQAAGTWPPFPEETMTIARPLGVALALLAPQLAMAADFDGRQLTALWGIPFAGVLLSIALLPLLAPHFWHHHFGKV